MHMFKNMTFNNGMIHGGLKMVTISCTAARNNLAKIMDGVHDNHEPIMITRQKGIGSFDKGAREPESPPPNLPAIRRDL